MRVQETNSGKPPTNSDDIRAYVARAYVEPARREGRTTFSVRAGDVSKVLPVNGINHVISALQSRRFREDHGLTLEDRQGPAQGNNTVLVFAFRNNQRSQTGMHEVVVHLDPVLFAEASAVAASKRQSIDALLTDAVRAHLRRGRHAPPLVLPVFAKAGPAVEFPPSRVHDLDVEDDLASLERSGYRAPR